MRRILLIAPTLVLLLSGCAQVGNMMDGMVHTLDLMAEDLREKEQPQATSMPTAEPVNERAPMAFDTTPLPSTPTTPTSPDERPIGAGGLLGQSVLKALGDG